MLDHNFEDFVKRLGRDVFVKVRRVDFVMPHLFRVYYVRPGRCEPPLYDLISALEYCDADVKIISNYLLVDTRRMISAL